MQGGWPVFTVFCGFLPGQVLFLPKQVPVVVFNPVALSMRRHAAIF